MYEKLKRIHWETKLTIVLLALIILIGWFVPSIAAWSNIEPAISATEGNEVIVCQMPDMNGAMICAPIDKTQITNCWYFKHRGIIECEPGI